MITVSARSKVARPCETNNMRIKFNVPMRLRPQNRNAAYKLVGIFVITLMVLTFMTLLK